MQFLDFAAPLEERQIWIGMQIETAAIDLDLARAAAGHDWRRAQYRSARRPVVSSQCAPTDSSPKDRKPVGFPASAARRPTSGRRAAFALPRPTGGLFVAGFDVERCTCRVQGNERLTRRSVGADCCLEGRTTMSN